MWIRVCLTFACLFCLSNFILKLYFVETLVYLVWLDSIMFYYVEFIQIANGNLSRFNVVVLQKLLCVIRFNPIEFNSCHVLFDLVNFSRNAMLVFLVLDLFSCLV